MEGLDDMLEQRSALLAEVARHIAKSESPDKRQR